ncbi:MAG: bacteriohemerythrin [Magnetococcales bacterium]|nr:bacteriohemerythrin [Magnetococcales bacterium]
MDKIIKVYVSPGIYWVEVPEADLRIQCGCPADSIKHLIKRGMVIQKESKGMPCETGPNAILLSDMMVQNGSFSNLGEFTVLQMLYKQGMILPNHPNNTGVKPLIIGMPEQVSAQMQYIYRGNYGLVSEAEMIQAGATPELAKTNLRMKLSFAFGKISSSADFLDTLMVGDNTVEIRNGVTIERLEMNIFRFGYQDESVEVNLNLEPDQQYESAYPLGFQKIDREFFAVVHSGEGDGWDINRPTMSSILMYHGKIYLIDAGPNLLHNLTALGIGLDEIAGIFHTHAHDDHFAGIPTLMQAGHKLTYFAEPMVRASVQKKVAALLSTEEERFEDFFNIHDLKMGVWNDLNGLEVKPLFSPHPQETTIFLFRTLGDEGYKTYAHFADIVAQDVLKGMIEEDESKPGVTQAFYDQIAQEYLQSVDLKKVDIGGGMIHGVAKDFIEDKSKKIILSHTCKALTRKEKMIGSNAPHGATDILIPSKTFFLQKHAIKYLKGCFPEMRKHDRHILLNNDIIEYNPGEIVCKRGEIPTGAFLLLTGIVEKLHAEESITSQLSAGALIGELTGLHGTPSGATYRCASYVEMLHIPTALYIELVSRNNMMQEIASTWSVRSFLKTTHLFGEGVSHTRLGRIINTIQTQHFEPGQVITCRDLGSLNVVHKGRFARKVGSETIDTLKARDFFGEEGAVFDFPCLFRIEALEPSVTYQIPGPLVENIPVVRWKLFESYLKRAMRIIHAGKKTEVFTWREEFNVQVSGMDTQHKRLVEIANSIIEILRSTQDRGSLERAFETLEDYTKYHFDAEEKVMEQYGYPDLEEHKKLHATLMERVRQFRTDLQDIKSLQNIDFKTFFTNWLVQHILTEDRKYGTFLNNQCIF